MKKQDTMRDFFGLTQIEMAMLLKISRARYSMYESGKRELPLHANVILGTMLEQLKNSKTGKNEQLPHVTQQLTATKIMLQEMLKENEYNLHTVVRNIATLERKYEAHVKALHLVNNLDTISAFKTEPDFLNVIKITAIKGVAHNGLPKLVKLRLRKATLEQESLLLKAELKKLSVQCKRFFTYCLKLAPTSDSKFF